MDDDATRDPAGGGDAAEQVADIQDAEAPPEPPAYELYVGGVFVPSESGRSYPVTDPRGGFLANAAQASRRDVREAVAAAGAAFTRWSAADAAARGEALYRVAELLTARREEFAAEVTEAEGANSRRAQSLVDTAISRWLWYTGWTDKIAAVLGAVNPVAGPYLCVSVPEPSGVAGVLAPQSSSLLGLVSVLAPVLATGNTAVVVASQERPLPAVRLAEVFTGAGLPGGVANMLTGRTAELAPWLAVHSDVRALDLTGAPEALRVDLERMAAGTVKRVLPTPDAEPDWTRHPDLSRLRAFLEIKTVWQPTG